MGGLEKTLYLNASDITIKRNFMENYTYHVRPDIANTTSITNIINRNRITIKEYK